MKAMKANTWRFFPPTAMAGLALVAVCLAAAMAANAGWDPNELERAQQTVANFKQTDPGLKTFFDKASGYAVFPSIIKGAVGVGGAHGKGILFEHGKAIGEATMTQGTIGFQLGGQQYSEILFFKDADALKRFKQGNLEFAAQASAVAATTGAAANAAYSNGVAVFSLAKKGLMFEASIGGQTFGFKPRS